MTSTESDEVERLRRRVAELESQLAAEPQTEAATAQERRSRWRAAWAAALITLACVLAPLSVVAVWASTEVSDTEAYVETVAPLADDPGVQSALADEVTEAVLDYIDLEAVTSGALESLAQQDDVPPRVAAVLPGLSVPLTNGVEEFTRTEVENILASSEFAELWEFANRVAHEQVVKLLEGNEGGAVTTEDGAVILDLSPIIALVKERLVTEGFSLATNIPTVDKTFVLVESDAITEAQVAYRVLNRLGVWLPLIALALFAAGVALAGDRRRALLRGSLGVTAATVLFGVALAVVRALYVDSTPAGVLTAEAAGSVFDTLTRFLRTGLRSLAVLGLVVALAAYLTGPSASAARTRSSLKNGIGSLRGGAQSMGWKTGRVGIWIDAHKRALGIGAMITGGLVLMYWSRPTGWVVVITAVVVLLAVAVIEFLATPPVEDSTATKPPVEKEAVPTSTGPAP